MKTLNTLFRKPLALYGKAVGMITLTVLVAFIAALPTRASPGLGLYLDDNSNYVSTMSGFDSWLGNPVYYQMTFCQYDDWSEWSSQPYYTSIIEPWVQQGPNYVSVISLGLLPSDDADDWANLENGNDDQYFTEVAQNIVNEVGMTAAQNQIIIRLGWEMLGDWYPWTCNPYGGTPDPTDYAESFAHVVNVMRQTIPNLQFCWCVPIGWFSNFDWTQAYPGDAYVNYIGADCYEQFAGSDPWATLTGDDPGLPNIRAFAQEHNKPEAYPEWGEMDTANGGYGDDPSFIQNMYNWFTASGANVAWQSYWNTAADGGEYLYPQDGGSNYAPNSSAMYQSLFGGSTAYNGPHNLPGTFKAADYDLGGQGVAYNAFGPYGGQTGYRADNNGDVAPDGSSIGWSYAGEWYNYTVQVNDTGTYLVIIPTQTDGNGATFHLEDENGNLLTGEITVPNDGGWTNVQNVVTTANLTAGQHKIRLFEDTAGSGENAVSNFFTFTFYTPYNGPHNIPGTINAGDYDLGGAGVAYYLNSPTGGQSGYRTDNNGNVASDGSSIGWTSAGEWYNYTVNVANSGTYTVTIPTQSLGGGGTFHLQDENGNNLTGELTAADTGGWTNWQNVTASVYLTAGPHLIQLVMDSDSPSGTWVSNFSTMTFN